MILVGQLSLILLLGIDGNQKLVVELVSSSYWGCELRDSCFLGHTNVDELFYENNTNVVSNVEIFLSLV